MATGLKISKEGALDLVSLGALVHRLDPGIIPAESNGTLYARGSLYSRTGKSLPRRPRTFQK